MHYIALATDYDGTIAEHGVVDEDTIKALEKLRPAARRLILVTGRELAGLEQVMPRLDLFDVVVAENGALLYWPDTRDEKPLAPPPPAAFVARLKELGVDPLSLGRVIVASWEPNQEKVLQAIQELGLELSIIFNKGAVMVLPAGVNKASGLLAALGTLDIAPMNCLAVGDAENDMAFLDVAGASVAVANAVPALQQHAAWVTPGDHGRGVAELIDRLLETDFAAFDPKLARQTVALAETDDHMPLMIAPHREISLLAGASGGGKSTFTQGLTERLAAQGFRFCILDPEGDYEDLPEAVGVGTGDRPPELGEITALLRKTQTDAVVNILDVPLDDRPAFFAKLLPELMGLRAELGRPDVVIVDEAHHMLPPQWDAGAAALPQAMEGFLFISMMPSSVSPRLLEAIDRLLVVGSNPQEALDMFCRARGLRELTAPDNLERGQILSVDVKTQSLKRLNVIPGTGQRLRHGRKYAEGTLGEDNSFWFRGPAGKLNLRAQNLMMFLQMAEGVDAETWQFHRGRHDYSNWFEHVIKDRELAREAAEIETADTPPERARKRLRQAIERRYTLPA